MSEYSELKYKYEKVDHIRGMLESNLIWAVQGLKRIYALQTESEQSCGQTRDWNGIGFSGVDSEILSSFAVRVEGGKALSNKQQVYLHKYMPKYAKQLYLIAENKI